MKLKLKKKNLIILIVISLILIGGITFGLIKVFSGKEETSKTTKNENKEENFTNIDNETINPEVQIVDINSKSRPYAVMINNLSAARPYHTGLQQAYLVYEIVVEGGITRYLALFKDNLPETVGSVRSARHYYLDYAMENDAYYIHWGWSPQAQSDISTLGINNINGLTYGSPYFFRQKLPVSTEHTGFANLKAMENLVNIRKFRTDINKPLLLDYSATNIDIANIENSKEATKIDLKYSAYFTTNYEYDSNSNTYKQSVNNKSHTDYETKEQYTVKNIITYKVPNNNISGDDKGRQNLNNIGSGDGFLITGGYSIPIKWHKEKRNEQTIYTYLDGTKIKVNDGNTWIHIVPENGNISIS